MERHDTVIIGGGQAGLAMSYCLKERAREHVILERARVAERWRSERWASLYFQFPNWSLRLPGFSYSGDDSEGFSHQTDIIRFIDAYATFVGAPVRSGMNVSAVIVLDDGSFHITTDNSQITASRIVVATGPYQRPAIPAFASALPASVLQLHASKYHTPDQLPPGAVLIVGSGSSGAQIAEELCHLGRKVYLCLGRHRRAPRRYLDRDVLWWALEMGMMDTPIDSFPDRRHPPPLLVTGVEGGHDLDVRQLGRDGVVLLGKLVNASDGRLRLSDDRHLVIAEAEKGYVTFMRGAAVHAARLGLDGRWEETGNTSTELPPMESTLDVERANIRSVIWSTGYSLEFDWLQVPVFDERGRPIQQRGVSSCAGLYFLGLHWMHTLKSSTLFGVGEDAAFIANHMDRASG